MSSVLKYPVLLFRLGSFTIFYFKELFFSSFVLARDILWPARQFKHGIVAVDIDIQSDFGILLFSNLLSMTPGTLTIELTPERDRIYIHTMYLDDAEAFRRKVKHDFERRINNLLKYE